MKTLQKKLEGLEVRDLLSLQDFIKNLLYLKAVESARQRVHNRRKRRKVPILSNEQWESIMTACQTCKYLPLIRFIRAIKNKPVEIQVFNGILRDLGFEDAQSSFNAFQFLAVPCINSTLKNKELGFRLRRLGLEDTNFCFFEE